MRVIFRVVNNPQLEKLSISEPEVTKLFSDSGLRYDDSLKTLPLDIIPAVYRVLNNNILTVDPTWRTTLIEFRKLLEDAWDYKESISMTHIKAVRGKEQ